MPFYNLRVVSNMNDSQAIDIIYDYFLNYIIFFYEIYIFFLKVLNS